MTNDIGKLCKVIYSYPLAEGETKQSSHIYQFVFLHKEK